MKPIFVRDAKSNDDIRNCSEWAARIAKINLLDTGVFSYPATRVLCAYQHGGEPQLYMPVQSVYMLDALAPRPGSEGIIEAQALKALVADLVSTAHRTGVGEIYFPCRDERVIKFGEHNGFERFDYPMLRMKV